MLRTARLASRYKAIFNESINDPVNFWGKAADELAVQWDAKYTTVLDRINAPLYRWFKGGSLNTCFNALDIHVNSGLGDKVALIYDSPNTGIKKSYTYVQLLAEVKAFAGVLSELGVNTGDRVVIYMPMIPEAVIAMLACARLGATHSVVFGGFAAAELAKRLNDCKPKVVVTASCGFLDMKRHIAYKPLVDEAIKLCSDPPETVIVKQRQPVVAELTLRDLDWDKAMATTKPVHVAVPVDSNHPLYILYTSGTTGDPKGILRDTAGHIVALKWSMKNIYGANQDSVFWAASDIGWVVGHSYIVYAPLFCGMTTVLFDGKPVGTPDAGTFWRVLDEHKVDLLFTAPTAFRAIRKEDPHASRLKEFSLRDLKAIFLAGEHADPETVVWLQTALQEKFRSTGAYVFDHYWQTETGWPMVAPCVGLHGPHQDYPTRLGSAGHPVPGYDFHFMDDDGHVVSKPHTDNDALYNLVVRLPLPPGTFPTMYQNDQRFVSAYLTTDMKYYRTGDAGYADEQGNYFIMARTDDVINVAGHRLSTSAIEEIIQTHPMVAETACFGVKDNLKGQVPVACCVLKDGVERTNPDVIGKEIVKLVREKMGAITCLSTVHLVERLPKTRSGKILRKEMANMVDGKPYRTPGTLEDPGVMPYLKSILGRKN